MRLADFLEAELKNLWEWNRLLIERKDRGGYIEYYSDWWNIQIWWKNPCFILTEKKVYKGNWIPITSGIELWRKTGKLVIK